jgi:tetratricopeptide (TPR) repeat protein
MDAIWQQINEAIHRRDTELVGQLIPKYLKANRSSPESLYEASEFYRKITDYKNALRVLPKESTQSSASNTSEAETKLELQLARLLNIFGASNYALRMIERIRDKKRNKSKIEMVEIYCSNHKFSRVVELLDVDFPMPESEPWHQDWLLHFYLSFALSELKQTDQAIARMDKVRALSSSPLIQAMTLSYKGKYILAAGNPEEALPVLLESQRFFQHDDQTADHANLQIHLGECLLQLEKFSEAQKALQIAEKILYRPALKPEEWIGIPLLLERIPGYQKSNQRLASRLLAMYGPEYSLLKIANREEFKNKSEIFSVSRSEVTRKKRHLDRESDTVWNNKKATLGLGLVEELIYNLIYAGQYGLPQFRLYDLLWPNEPFSFDQHEKRLKDVVGRARTMGYKISWKDLHLQLTSNDVSVGGRPEKVIRGLSFLSEHPVFTRKNVEDYYSISNTSAKTLCREWLSAGQVVFEKPAKYRTIS